LSAFAVVYERSNTPVEPGVLERVMDRLKHRGPDGRDVCLTEQAAMGHWHFWTTPEEVGERQPLKLSGLPFTIVLDGRLDNRLELISGLNINPAEVNHLSDAALILHAYERWGEHCFEHLIGEFALAILDQRSGELMCGRDALGDRTLFYSFKGTRLVVASEPWAVAGADGSGNVLNESAVAHYFALEATEDGQTLFNNIFEILPAHAMLVNGSCQRTWRYWQPDPSRRVRGRSDEEYAEEFRALLEQSVRCRMRSTTPVGVLMSGGLDSTSVTCLATRILRPQPLTTLSYVFDELTECDERQYINSVKKKWDIHSIQIPCDDAWPLKDWQHWPANPNRPEGNPYRLPRERAYQRAQTEGLRVLLTGGFGDHLYSAGNDWLADYITEGQLLKAGKELSLYIRYAGLRWLRQAGYLQRLARRLLDKLPGGKQLHHRPIMPAWLTNYSTGYLSGDRKAHDPMLARYGELLELRAALSCSAEVFYASRHALESRHPYRDRRLVEYILALPAYQLYYRGWTKYILRTAMRDILPDSIRARIQPTSMMSLFNRGVEREGNVLQKCFQDPDAAWRRFVKPDWLLKRWNNVAKPDQDGPTLLVPWLCISYETWYYPPVL
jgi:asparagine synthase (glutamine-hydrolysing)